MSWKAVELQVALPRTHNAGQLQEQMQQRGQLVQDHLAHHQLKEQQLNRTTITKSKEKDFVRFRTNDEKENKNNRESSYKKKNKKKKETTIKHPYLGKKIDYSG